MLYYHCGWPKTGTTSLQGALAGRSERLAEEGIVYAPQWRSLTPRLARPDAEAAIEELRRFLEPLAEADVLVSDETLTSLLWNEERRAALRALLAAAAEVMPVTCVWTLRRLDEMIVSMYTAPDGRGVDSPSSLHRARDLSWIGRTFEGNRQLEQTELGDSVYVKYEPGGDHNGQLLRAFGLAQSLVADLEGALAQGRRLNARLSHKQAVALRHAEALAARCGVPLDRGRLYDLFRDGLCFDRDRRFVPLGPEARSDLHRDVLALAREKGFEPYVRFFADDEIEPEAETPLDLEVLDDDDVARLVSHLAGAR